MIAEIMNFKVLDINPTHFHDILIKVCGNNRSILSISSFYKVHKSNDKLW